MDNQEMVFNAARDGDLHRLKKILDGKSRNDISSLVSARTNDSTPLIMACKNGHLDAALYLIGKCKADIEQEMLDGKSRKDVVSLVSAQTDDATPLLMACANGHLDVAQYLIERCNADIEQVGSVSVDEYIYEEVFPLWCAAAAGYLDIVKMLIKCNASVNNITNNSKTALYIACSLGQFEIAKFLIEHGADIEIAEHSGRTCLMSTCYGKYYQISKYLLECGADTNRRNHQGVTALHVCAQLGTLDILKMLIKNGAKSFCDSDGATPLITAALEGQCQIVEYFIHEFICTKQEQVNALELLGSFFLRERNDAEKTVEYWKRAMELRYEDGEFPLEKPVTRSPIASCVDSTEVRTLQQLEELVSDPDEMGIQALLIVERIIGLHHPQAFPYIVLNTEVYHDDGNFSRYKDLWMYALDVELKTRKGLNLRIVIILSTLVELFSLMVVESSPSERSLHHDLFQDILYVFKSCLIINGSDLCVPITEMDDDSEINLHRILITATRLVGLICKLQPLNMDNDVEFKKALKKLVRWNPKGMNGSTLLHLACSDTTSSYCDDSCLVKFPSTEVVDMLLNAGACPNAVDASNNTPLHVAAMSKPFDPAVFKALVNHGAHLDFCNNERKTPFQLAEGIPALDIYPMHYINLKCLCAHAVRKHEIVYEGSVPKKIKLFLDSH